MSDGVVMEEGVESSRGATPDYEGRERERVYPNNVSGIERSGDQSFVGVDVYSRRGRG